MGESVAEATITNWLKEEGDTIAVDESVVEIATDKVDSDVPSEVAGILIEKVCGRRRSASRGGHGCHSNRWSRC